MNRRTLLGSVTAFTAGLLGLKVTGAEQVPPSIEITSDRFWRRVFINPLPDGRERRTYKTRLDTKDYWYCSAVYKEVLSNLPPITDLREIESLDIGVGVDLDGKFWEVTVHEVVRPLRYLRVN